MASADIPEAILAAIEAHFHAPIRKVAGDYVDSTATLDLPQLAALVDRPEEDDERAWFPVPGMYGGFAFQLEGAGTAARLVVDSWCRVVDNSGLRHEITAQGVKLIDEGFEWPIAN